MKNKLGFQFAQVSSPRGVGLTLSCLTLAFVVLQSCKQQSQNLSKSLAVNEDQEGATEVLTTVQNTTLKTSLLQSEGLGVGATCPVPQGTILIAESVKPEGIDHWRIFDLSEIRLPTGEVGVRKRFSNEETPGSSSNPVPVQTPAAGSAGMSPLSSVALPSPTPSATAAPSSTAAPTTNTVKTPAELLGCEMLNGESFLVFAPHFNRKLERNSASGSGTGRTSGEIDSGDDGQFMWPTKGRKIRSDSGGAGYYGAPRGYGRSHQGLDIVAAVGEPIYATRAGTIIDPAYEYSYGKVLDVRHQDGYSSRYAHLTSFSYSHGAYVGKGEKIATAGRTGNASGSGIIPHLHFEIRKLGRLLNPAKLLP